MPFISTHFAKGTSPSAKTFVHYDEDSAIIRSNLAYATIHQLGGQAVKNKKVTIPARPYIKLRDEDLKEIMNIINFLKKRFY